MRATGMGGLLAQARPPVGPGIRSAAGRRRRRPGQAGGGYIELLRRT